MTDEQLKRANDIKSEISDLEGYKEFGISIDYSPRGCHKYDHSNIIEPATKAFRKRAKLLIQARIDQLKKEFSKL